MFDRVKDREEELRLLDFAVKEASSHKQLIEDLEGFEVELKKDGTIHKTKENRRLALIRLLKKELKEMKKFFIERREEPKEWKTGRYTFSNKVSENRRCI